MASGLPHDRLPKNAAGFMYGMGRNLRKLPRGSSAQRGLRGGRDNQRGCIRNVAWGISDYEMSVNKTRDESQKMAR